MAAVKDGRAASDATADCFDSHPQNSGQPDVLRLASSPVVAGLVSALGLLWPLLFLAARGVSPGSMAEESTGYRYFGSLVPFLGEPPTWTPQGQAPALVHIGLQALLSAAGMPPEQLHPRIDLWTFLAAAIPSVLAALALVWACSPLQSKLGTWLVTLLTVVTAYEQRAGAGLVLTYPDYYAWVTPIALVALGWCLRVVRFGPVRWLWTWGSLALFGGLAAGVKATLLVYPLVVALVLLSASRWRLSAVVGAALSAAAGGGLALAIIGAAVGRTPGLALLLEHYERLKALDGNGRAGFNDTPLEWLTGEAFRTIDFVALVVCLPIILGVLLVLVPGRRGLLFALLCGSLWVDAFAYQRFYYPTISEVNAFGLLALPIIAVLLGPRIPYATIIGAGLAGILGLLAVARLVGFSTDLAPAFEAADYASWRIQASIDTGQRVLFLIPNNGLRTITLDSAIDKGGIAMTERDHWGSPAMELLFGAQRSYVLGQAMAPWNDRTKSQYDQTFPTPLDLKPYGLVVYVATASADGEKYSLELLRWVFGVTVDGLRCDERLPVWAPNVVGRGAPFHSSEWRLESSVIVLCRPPA